jgi:hypothetical protein
MTKGICEYCGTKKGLILCDDDGKTECCEKCYVGDVLK